MIKVIVCIKQVPDIQKFVKIDEKTGTIDREHSSAILNPYDLYAIEQALQLKENYNAKVTLLSMGPKKAESAIREGLAMGADEGVLLTDKLFAGADTYATSYTLAWAIKKKLEYDLVFCGKQAIDGDTAQVGIELAVLLDINYITYVRRILNLEDRYVIVERQTEYGIEIAKTKMPALFTFVRYLTPRLPNLRNLLLAKKKQILYLSAQDLGLAKENIGKSGSLTCVEHVYKKTYDKNTRYIEGNSNEIAWELVKIIKKSL
jgi:electron transfer flavoprotein beta subunit